MWNISLSTRRRLVCAWISSFLCCLEVESFARSPSAAGWTVARGTSKQQWTSSRRLISPTDQVELARNNEIVVSSEISLPFPSEIAYDAFSDMNRQTSWSPWLRSVEYTDDSRNTTLWKMRYLGVSTSWVSVCTYESRPNTICWKSIRGLPNRGRVDFTSDSETSHHTRMKMTMTFQVPRLIARMFTSNGKVSRMVEQRMILPTLETFRNDVVQNDLRADQTMTNRATDMPISRLRR